MANVIFDFDGTLADTLETAIGIFEGLLRGGEPLPPGEIERLRGMSPLKLAAELHIRPWKLPWLLARGRAQMRSQMKHVELFDGVPALIRQLVADGHQLYLVSSNSVQNIRPLLKRESLNTEFIKLYGGAGLFGKARLLKKVMKRRRLTPEHTFYVGDEVRDIEAARHAGIRIISVTWGYNNQQVLVEHQPDVVALKPADIRKALQA